MTSLTVTALQGGSGASSGMLLRVKVLTNAALAGSPATGTAASGGSSAAANAAVTTTTAGSQVYGALSFWHSADGSFTAEGNTTLLDNVTDSVNGNLYGTCRTASATVTPGAVTVGASGPSDTGANAALLEVLPSGGTVTEDGSSPASISTTSAELVTTASFTPPPGSLLVAMVGTDGTSSAAVSMTVTDSSGLTWSARAEADTAFYGYAGVWTAQVPSAPSFPQAPLDLGCDLLLAGSWTDVSDYVYQRSSLPQLGRGRPDESAATATAGTASWEWNNRDGQFSPDNPLSPYYGQLVRNTPVRFSVPAQANHLRIEDDQASSASCPDAAGLDITGDIDIRVDMDFSGYQLNSSGAASVALITKFGGTGGGNSWFFEYGPSGLVFGWYDGTATWTAPSVLAPPPRGRQCLRATLAHSTGTVTFYTGPAGGCTGATWTQLGTAVSPTSGASTSIHTSAADVTVGNYDSADLATASANGSYYEAAVYSGIAGTLEAHPVFTSQSAGTTSFTDAESNTWTLNGTAEISDRDYRWHGQMSSQPPTQDVTGKDLAVQAGAGGALRLISQGSKPPLMSPVKRAITLLSGAAAPVAYWPMEDAAGATVLGSAAGGQPMTISGTPQLASNSDFACSAPLPVTNGAAFTGHVSYAGWTDNQAAFLLEIPAAAEADKAVIASLTTGGTVQTLTLRYRTAGSGSLELYGYDSSGAQLFDSGALSFALNGVRAMASVALSDAGGGDITWHCDVFDVGGVQTGVSGTISGTVGPVTRVALNRDGTLTGTVTGHCAVLAAYQQLYDLFTYITPGGVVTGALNAWAGEPAAVRFARLAGENAYQARVVGAPAMSAAMGAQAIDTLMNLLQACEDTDCGQIFEPRGCLGLGYRTLASMYSQSPAITLDYASGQPGGTTGGSDSGLAPTYDDQLSRNDWTVTRTAGAAASGTTYQAQLDDGSAMSVTVLGDYADTRNVNSESDSQVPNTAWWLVHAGTVPGARWPQIPVNLARSAVSGLYWDILDTDIGDFIEVTNPPGLLTYNPVQQLAWGTTETLGGFTYTIEYNAVPEAPYEVAMAGTARADTAGSQLATSYSSSAVSFSVDVTAGNLWITTSGFPSMFPFDVNIAGERITVTAITGSSSPQTFTVTRAVNGVSKAQAAGAPVALWNTPVAAL